MSTSTPVLVPGLVVGSWVLIRRVPNKGWLARCACGTESTVFGHHLRNGTSRRCAACATERKKKHGMSHTPEHDAWTAMRQMCGNPTNARYHLFGGKGVKVCPRWHESFVAFYEDMGPCRWDEALRRLDDAGDFEPGNAYWGKKRA